MQLAVVRVSLKYTCSTMSRPGGLQVGSLRGLLQYLVPSAAVQEVPQDGRPGSYPSTAASACLTAAVQQLSRLYSRTATEQLLLLAYLDARILPRVVRLPFGLATAAVRIRETVPSPV